MANFQRTYIRIAEATAASRDAHDTLAEPLGDSADYLSTGLGGNVKIIVDVQTSTFNEETISEVQFELDNLSTANSSWTQMQDLTALDTPYAPIVQSLNNYVETYVLGQPTDNANSVGGVYQSTLQLFIEIDCAWTDPSIGAPQSWLDLSTSNGFTVQ